jgi:hypothetical protein
MLPPVRASGAARATDDPLAETACFGRAAPPGAPPQFTAATVDRRSPTADRRPPTADRRPPPPPPPQPQPQPQPQPKNRTCATFRIASGMAPFDEQALVL